jgi:hypothetical protein
MEEINSIETDSVLVEKRRADALAAMQIKQDVEFLQMRIEKAKVESPETVDIACFTRMSLPLLRKTFK